MQATRIYRVIDRHTNEVFLVKSTHPVSAVNAVTRGRFAYNVATQDQLVELLGEGGVEIIDTTKGEKA